jgi:DNA-binding transcriptional MerR regulator
MNALDRYRNIESDLDDLVVAVADLVSAAGVDQTDGRVTGRPDGRGVRYYQTIGVLGKPLRYDGRRAVYGYRHLLELVTIKLLQAQGLSLAHIQRALTGVTTARLEAAVAEALVGGGGDRTRVAPPGGRLPAAPAPPAPVPAASPESAPSPLAPSGSSPAAPAASAPAPFAPPTAALPRALVAAEVAPGVTVTIDPDRISAPAAVIAHIRRALRGDA